MIMKLVAKIKAFFNLNMTVYANTNTNKIYAKNFGCTLKLMLWRFGNVSAKFL